MRITSLSELNGAPEPGVATQPPDPARLRDIDPKAHLSTVTITGGRSSRSRTSPWTVRTPPAPAAGSTPP